MKEIIESFCAELEERATRIKQKAEREFFAVGGAMANSTHAEIEQSPKKNNSKILYFIGVMLMLFAITRSEGQSTWFYWVLGIIALAYGYNISRRTSIQAVEKYNLNHSNSTALISEMSSIVTKYSKEWEDYVSTKNELVQNEIKKRLVQEEEKSSLLAKVRFYETIKFSIADMRSAFNSGADTLLVKSQQEQLFYQAIDLAAKKQLEKWKSIL